MKRAAAGSLLGGWPGGGAPITETGVSAVREVTLYGAKAAGRVALVDDDDYDLVMRHRWHVMESHSGYGPGGHRGPYAKTNVRKPRQPGQGRGQTTLLMHILIMGVRRIDHADGYGLNNQKENLRPYSGGQNNQNARPYSGGTSAYKGVSWNSRRGKWRATIKTDGKLHFLGNFTVETDAAHAYDAAAIRLFGPFARPNFPDHQAA